MAVEERLKSKLLYKLVLYLVKILPIFISGIYLLNTVLSYYGIDTPILSYIVQFLFILFMYAASYTFRFCSWHRMFIHYIFIVLIINIIDYHLGIPVSNRRIFIAYIILTTGTLFLAFYLKFKHHASIGKTSNKRIGKCCR